MLGKLLLTLAVIAGAYAVIRARMRAADPNASRAAAPRPPLVPPPLLRNLAFGLVVMMVTGSLLWLYLDWEARREVVSVQVINANTGQITNYQARRGEIGQRGFETLDGRRVELSDVDRMVLQ